MSTPELRDEAVDSFWPMMQTMQTMLEHEEDGIEKVSGFISIMLSIILGHLEYRKEMNRDAVITWLYTVFLPQVVTSYDALERQETC